MKTKTMKKALSLFLAVLMIALALPFTLLTVGAEGGQVTISNVAITLKKSNGGDWSAQYGSINGMIDGDAYDSNRSADDSWPYFYSEYLRSNSKYYYLDDSGNIAESTEDTASTYRGYVVFELSALSEMDSLTIWLAADGHNSDAAKAWSNPTANWNMCNAYDILSSTDGEIWTKNGEFDDMCGTGSAKGVGFPDEGDLDYASKTQDGYERVGHKVALNGTIAKYVAVAIKEGNNETASGTGEALRGVVIGEVTVEGTEYSAPVEVEIAGIQPSTTDPDAFRLVGTTTGLDVEEVGFKVDITHTSDERLTSPQSASIKDLELVLKKDNGEDVPVRYGAVDGIIDGDRYQGGYSYTYPYYYSYNINSYTPSYYIDADGKIVRDTSSKQTYYGYVILELAELSAVDSVTLWLASDADSENAAAAWSNSSAGWNTISAYDILHSKDGETWTLVSEFDDMCGSGYPEQGDASYTTKTQDGFLRVGHKMALGDAEAQYIMLGIRGGNTDKNAAVVIGELTVDGTIVADTIEVTKTATFTDGTTTVYNSILADGETVSFDGKYVYALGLDGIPQNGTLDIDVTPYFVPKGTDVKIYGDAATFEFVDGKVNEYVKVMAYNICNQNDDELGTLNERVDYIAAQIKSVNPDIVMLNEAHEYGNHLESQDLDMNTLVGKCGESYGIVEFKAEESTNVILYKTDKFNLESSEYLYIGKGTGTAPNGDTYDRDAAIAKLVRKSDNKEIVAVSTHLSVEGGTDQIRALLSHLKNNYGDVEHRIIAGDFNAQSDTVNNKNGKGQNNKYYHESSVGLYDYTYVDANTKVDVTGTYGDLVLDYIYSTNSIANNYRVIKAANADKASDHYAVYAALLFN